MKIDIIFGILLTLIAKGTTTASYLANKYSISTRTVYRYISILDTNNIPTVTKTGRGGGISILNNVKFGMFFTEQEKHTLLLLTQTIANQPLKISLQTKLLALR